MRLLSCLVQFFFAVAFLGVAHALGCVPFLNATVALGVTDRLTLLDIAKQNGNDKAIKLIEAVQENYPELASFPARTIKGTSFKSLERLTYPEVAFRNANEGSNLLKSTYGNKTTECFIIDPQVQVDKMVAESHEDGREIVLARETGGVMMGIARTIAKQIYYGKSNDAKGFPGLTATVNSSYEVDATDNTAKTSVWAIKWGEEEQIRLLGGNNRVLDMFAEWRVQTCYDSNAKPFTGLVNSINGWLGLQLLDQNAFGRIKNIGTTTGKGMTDILYWDLIAKMPANWKPDVVIMNKRSQNQLRKSRATTLIVNPPLPTTMDDGTPILVTDALSIAES